MGDDKTDEDMFAAIQHHLQRSSSTDNVGSKDGTYSDTPATITTSFVSVTCK
jgi:trehalose-6-phosphatase